MDTHHLEIERRYLITAPDKKALLDRPGAWQVAVTQMYLTAPKGTSRRIRKSVGAQTVYTYTEKIRHSALVRQESEAQITRDAYLAYAEKADPACAPVEKVRISVPIEGYVWEVDVFPFWPDVAVLEVELTEASEAPQPPACFHVLKEVTEVASLTNHSLAASIKKGETEQLLASVL